MKGIDNCDEEQIQQTSVTDRSHIKVLLDCLSVVLETSSVIEGGEEV